MEDDTKPIIRNAVGPLPGIAWKPEDVERNLRRQRIGLIMFNVAFTILIAILLLIVVIGIVTP